MPAINSFGREPIDGRPLYQYRVDLTSLDMLEAAINHPLSGDSRRIQALAPVAAARFASNYEEGTPSWAHCGPEILRLYEANGARFRTLMTTSFGRYRIPLVTRPGADLLLETVIGQAGLPSGMLRAGRPIRRILDRLMRDVALGSGDLLDSAKSQIDAAVENGDLRQAYRNAGHLPRLCADLVTAVVDLTVQASWDGGSLDRIWQLPGWERSLPFRVEEDAAREIVSHLLNVALAASEGAGCSIERLLTSRAGEWSISTRAEIGVEGVEIADAQGDVLAIHYAVGMEPVGEAFRARRKEGQRFVLATAVHDLSKGAIDRPVSLVASVDGKHVPIDCVGGAPLDEGSLWVFEPRNQAFAYRAPAPVRLRSSELMVAVPEGWHAVEGAVALPQRLLVNGVARALWKVTGKARFNSNDGDTSLVEAGYSGPQGYLDFGGKTPSFRVPGFSNVFLGNPIPRRIGGLAGRIEWRRAGASSWTAATLRNVVGHLQFRLVDSDGEVIAERRRVLVLPESLRPRLTNRNVWFALPADVTIAGFAPDNDGSYTIEFGAASRLQLSLQSAEAQFDLVFERPMPASFIDLATGEEISTGSRQVSSIAAGRIVASSALHDHIEVRRATDHWAAVQCVALRDNRLPLSNISEFLEALSFHPRGRTHALKVQFPNGPGLEVEPYRIRRQDGNIVVNGASSDVRLQLRALNPQGDVESDTIDLPRLAPETWRLPDGGSLNGLYLATDPTHQAAPCLVALGSVGPTTLNAFLETVRVADEDERCRALTRFYERITDNPHDGAASADLDDCLAWLGEFQFFWRWLDPFLVLASQPLLALKLLTLARLRGRVQAEQGLTWAMDEIPFLWNGVSPAMIRQLMEWSRRLYGESEAAIVSQLLDEIPRLQRMKNPATLIALLVPLREVWQAKVATWFDQYHQELELRPHALRDRAHALWEQVPHPQTAAALRERLQTIPSGADLDRTYLLAPYELAIANMYGVELDGSLRDDLLFARHMIEPSLFDDAHCTAMALLESAT